MRIRKGNQCLQGVIILRQVDPFVNFRVPECHAPEASSPEAWATETLRVLLDLPRFAEPPQPVVFRSFQPSVRTGFNYSGMACSHNQGKNPRSKLVATVTPRLPPYMSCTPH